MHSRHTHVTEIGLIMLNARQSHAPEGDNTEEGDEVVKECKRLFLGLDVR